MLQAFGRRRFDGTPSYYIDGNERMTGYRLYVMDRECNTAYLEDLLKREMEVVDQALEVLIHANDRIQLAEKAFEFLADKINELQETNKELSYRIKSLEDTWKLEKNFQLEC